MESSTRRAGRQRLEGIQTAQIVLTKDLIAQLDAEAARKGDTRSRIIREACHDLLRRRARNRTATQAEGV